MEFWQGKRRLAVVTAFVRQDGLPDFTLTEVEVTEDEHANGVHYDLVDTQLKERGLDEPWVHYDETEAPSFLLAAVREHLESSTAAPSEPEPVYF